MVSLWQEVLVFIVMFLIFLPLLSKVVRLASRTWDNREHLEKSRVRRIVFIVPTFVILVFFAVYFGVLAILSIIEF
ncbi:MAG: hypothetical protein ACXAD7_01860 [Candidatus Kariarchaeaceae archaeon]